MDRILIVNKPRGWTSHDVVDKVRRIYGVKKVGHAGTLDPMATGILIILIGQATRRQKEFMEMEKEYEAEITFGAETDTYDSEGIIAIEQSSYQAIKNLTKEEVGDALRSFEGEIEQTVPPYSAVKVSGKKLYELARRGDLEGVKLPRRKVFIKEIELLDFDKGDPSVILNLPALTRRGRFQNPDAKILKRVQDDANLVAGLPKAKIRVVCSKGTYIRSLAHDLGQKLGCGAYLSELVRTRVGKYKLGSEEVVDVENKLKAQNSNVKSTSQSHKS